MQGQLRGSIEDNVLTCLCWSELHAAQVSLRVPPSLFSTRAYQKIAEKAIEHLSKYGHPPGVHLQDIMEAELDRGSEGTFLRSILGEMYALQSQLDATFVLESLDRWIDSQKLSQAVNAAADALHDGEL